MNGDALRKHYERQFGPFSHMGPEDTAIWLRFLQLGGVRFAPFIYDLRVGDGTTMPSGSSKTAIAAAYALTTKRIDVVWMHDGQTIICELKKTAGSTAIGQLLLYRDLFESSHPGQPPVKLVLITDKLQNDMISTLIKFDIQVIEVGL